MTTKVEFQEEKVSEAANHPLCSHC